MTDLNGSLNLILKYSWISTVSQESQQISLRVGLSVDTTGINFLSLCPRDSKNVFEVLHFLGFSRTLNFIIIFTPQLKNNIFFLFVHTPVTRYYTALKTILTFMFDGTKFNKRVEMDELHSANLHLFTFKSNKVRWDGKHPTATQSYRCSVRIYRCSSSSIKHLCQRFLKLVISPQKWTIWRLSRALEGNFEKGATGIIIFK